MAEEAKGPRAPKFITQSQRETTASASSSWPSPAAALWNNSSRCANRPLLGGGLCFQGAGYNGWTSGRQNAQNLDLNRNFPDLTSEFYRLAASRGARTDHIPIPQHYWWGKVGAAAATPTPGWPRPQLCIPLGAQLFRPQVWSLPNTGEPGS